MFTMPELLKGVVVSGVPTSNDLHALVILFPALMLCRIIVENISSPLGRVVARATHGPKWVEKNEEKMTKLGEYSFKLLYHLIVTTWGYEYLSRQPWYTDTREAWAGWPTQPMDDTFKLYYLTQMAYALNEQFALYARNLKFGAFGARWKTNVRGDFREMAIHHAVTSALCVASYCQSFVRFGSLVMLLHDISEVPVEVCKMANFLKWKFSTAISFCCMCGFWVYFRLYIFPRHILYSIVSGECQVLVHTGGLTQQEYYFLRPLFVVLLGMLQLLHVFWFTIFLQMAYLLIVKDERQDMTSGEHHESERKAE